MKNFKKTEWIQEMQNQIDEKFGWTEPYFI
ncbi:hypothetical protein J2T04_003933 [Chryseobacterium lathyri]|jgi:hypothetical protein|uniref:Uncharacterized protein n=1 Tax=Chryseobacterium lathyri TaxID=395933 RepID=A0ABT9SU98_9FLAO|nr:hypothetical protein [Chryseobacterium lathyri]MDQ0064179.1 hypothetical protein [Chryseobacterium lathyri]